jgi:hypothetical protein
VHSLQKNQTSPCSLIGLSSGHVQLLPREQAALFTG